MFKRSVTGLALGIITIFALLYSIWSATLLLIIILVFSSREWIQHVAKREGSFASKNFLFITLFFTFFILFKLINGKTQEDHFDLQKINAILLFILSIYGASIITQRNWSFCQSWYSGIFYICFPILIGFSYLNQNFEQHRWIILGLIIINWCNDVFAYFTGSLIGKHPLAPAISPKKTIEGAAGGLIAAILAAWLVNQYLFTLKFNISTIVILGGAIWFAGTLGDLYESKLKRIIGIKDSGQLLPGHGGFLDRFDSFFFIIPTGIFVLSI